MTKSVYIHIPFCISKCKYCSFVSYVNTSEIDYYIKSLLEEIEHVYTGEHLQTLYFGGGTPSLLNIKQLKCIFEKFKIADNCEITLELNPNDATQDYLNVLFDIGINRLSIGSQTFDDKILKLIGRRHNSSEIMKSVEFAKNAGFKNISLDLIYGLPTQNQDNLQKDLKIISELDVQHISTYGLKIEKNSYFYDHLPKELPDDDQQADFYEFINEYLKKYGFYRYEISNFAKDNFYSRHNLNYWNNEEYYGFGVAAHGYRNGIRYFNTSDLQQYIKEPFLAKTNHIVTDKEKLEEEIFLGFRKTEGIKINKINKLYNIDFENKYKKVIKKYSPEYIEKTPEGYKLTLQGVLLSTIILSDFIE